ncbi:HAD family hydrolase [Butyricicoccus sp.]|uniref:HAD family hydrolase n=1 Tax=Butyricicoccus sp. TaxID=2049021 RepID=UPI003F182204
MKKGAIFDMDGLLFDTERIYREVWSSPAPGFVPEVHPAVAEAVCGTSGEHLQAILEHYYPGVDAPGYICWVLDRVADRLRYEVPKMPGCDEILSYLHANGVKLAVASSSRLNLIRRNLKNACIEHYFDAVISGDELESSKPAPDIFLIAAEQLGLAPEDCYVFEDGYNGIRAGAAAGCTTIMIPNLSEPTDEIRALCAAVYPGLPDALEAIRAGG